MKNLSEKRLKPLSIFLWRDGVFFVKLRINVDSSPSPHLLAIALSGEFDVTSKWQAVSRRICSTILLGVLPVTSLYLRAKVLSLMFIKFASEDIDKSLLRLLFSQA